MSVAELIDLIGLVSFWTVLIWNIFTARAEFSKYLIYKQKKEKSEADI